MLSHLTPSSFPKTKEGILVYPYKDWYTNPPLFAIAPNWKQPKFPSTGEWVNKRWYANTMEKLSNLKNGKCNNTDDFQTNYAERRKGKRLHTLQVRFCKRIEMYLNLCIT